MKKSYKVVGACPLVLPDGQRREPGDEFEAELPFELEAFLTQIEAISVQPPKAFPARLAPLRHSPPVVVEEEK